MCETGFFMFVFDLVKRATTQSAASRPRVPFSQFRSVGATLESHNAWNQSLSLFAHAAHTGRKAVSDRFCPRTASSGDRKAKCCPHAHRAVVSDHQRAHPISLVEERRRLGVRRRLRGRYRTRGHGDHAR